MRLSQGQRLTHLGMHPLLVDTGSSSWWLTPWNFRSSCTGAATECGALASRATSWRWKWITRIQEEEQQEIFFNTWLLRISFFLCFNHKKMWVARYLQTLFHSRINQTSILWAFWLKKFFFSLINGIGSKSQLTSRSTGFEKIVFFYLVFNKLFKAFVISALEKKKLKKEIIQILFERIF